MAHLNRYNHIMQIYDERQKKAKQDLSDRLEKIAKASPTFPDVQRDLLIKESERAKAMVNGDSALASNLEDEIANLLEKKKELLISAGFNEDDDKLSFICNNCKDSGFVDGVKCSCYKQLEAETLFDASNIRDILSQENFEAFNFDYFDKIKVDPKSGLTSYQMMEKNYKIAKDMADNFVPGEKNLLLIGKTGTGKTFLSNCIAKEILAKGHTVVYLSSAELFSKLSDATFNRNNIEEKEQILDCDLLIIDDLGTESNNSFVSAQLFNIINDRKLKKKSTIISTNYDLNQIRDSYSERVSSRILESYTICRFFNIDIRLIKRKEGFRKDF